MWKVCWLQRTGHCGVSAMVRIVTLWPVDGQCVCGSGRYGGLWLVAERGGEQLVPPLHLTLLYTHLSSSSLRFRLGTAVIFQT